MGVGKELSKGKSTPNKGSDLCEEVIVAAQLACLANDEQPCKARLEGLGGLLRALLKHLGFALQAITIEEF